VHNEALLLFFSVINVHNEARTTAVLLVSHVGTGLMSERWYSCSPVPHMGLTVLTVPERPGAQAVWQTVQE